MIELVSIPTGKVLARLQLVQGKVEAEYFDRNIEKLLTRRGVWDGKGERFVRPGDGKVFMDRLPQHFRRSSTIAVEEPTKAAQDLRGDERLQRFMETGLDFMTVRTPTGKRLDGQDDD